MDSTVSFDNNNRPNLLYILSDQHTPFVTGCYGDPLVQTPSLDRLAANSIRIDINGPSYRQHLARQRAKAQTKKPTEGKSP